MKMISHMVFHAKTAIILVVSYGKKKMMVCQVTKMLRNCDYEQICQKKSI